MRLVDIRGMAVTTTGIIKNGQPWYCKISVDLAQLNNEFPSHQGEASRAHLFDNARETYLRIYPTEVQRRGEKQKDQLKKINASLRERGKPEISLSTLRRVIADVRKINVAGKFANPSGCSFNCISSAFSS